MKISKQYSEIWGLRFEGGEERTFNLLPEIKRLEAQLSGALEVIERYEEIKESVRRDTE